MFKWFFDLLRRLIGYEKDIEHVTKQFRKAYDDLMEIIDREFAGAAEHDRASLELAARAEERRNKANRAAEKAKILEPLAK